jgi:hypothetical protein
MGIRRKEKKMRTEPCRVYIRGEYSRIREPLIFTAANGIRQIVKFF